MLFYLIISFFFKVYFEKNHIFNYVRYQEQKSWIQARMEELKEVQETGL